MATDKEERPSLLQRWVHDLFVEHPAQVHESYLQHAATAAWIGVNMAVGSIAAFVHAVVPGLFTHTASSIAAHVVQLAARSKPTKSEQSEQEELPATAA